MKLTIYTDGASRGNPGLSAYGFVIKREEKIVYQEGEYIGIATNNFAEYSAVLKALEYLHKNYNVKNLQVNFFMDSKLVAEQLSGRFKIKSINLKPLFNKIKMLTASLQAVSYQHIPRQSNKLADSLANQALDNL